MKISIPARSPDNASGLTLIEVTISFAVFVIMVLSVSMTLVEGMRQRQATFEWYQAMRGLRDTMAEIQENANVDQDLTANVGMGTTYLRYNAQTLLSKIAKLRTDTTTTHTLPVGVTVFPNELVVPGKFGGVQDLNFDGDSADDLGNASAGTDLKLIPVEITVTYTESNQTRTITLPRLVAKTTN